MSELPAEEATLAHSCNGSAFKYRLRYILLCKNGHIQITNSLCTSAEARVEFAAEVKKYCRDGKVQKRKFVHLYD